MKFVILKKSLDKHFKVDHADDCVWLNDLRGKKRVIHMTKEQARGVGKKLMDISKGRSIKEWKKYLQIARKS